MSEFDEIESPDTVQAGGWKVVAVLFGIAALVLLLVVVDLALTTFAL